MIEGPAHLLNKQVFGSGGRRGACNTNRATFICKLTAIRAGWDEDGTHAQFVSVPETDVLPLPQGKLSIEQAAAIGVPYITAMSAVRAAEVAEGKSVFIIGARGAVGSAMAQLCKWRKARVIGAGAC